MKVNLKNKLEIWFVCLRCFYGTFWFFTYLCNYWSNVFCCSCWNFAL